MDFSLPQMFGVLAVNTLIAAFLSAIGVGHSFAGNFVVSQCIGLCIYAGCLAGTRWAATPRGKALAMVLAVPLGAAAGVGLATLLLGNRSRDWLGAMAWQSLLIGLLFGTAISALFYLRSRMDQLEAELKERALREALAEKERVGAQLRMLQAQIEPHFLFNTLANLSVLIRSDPERAERLLGDLIAWLRATLQRTREADSTLGDEIELLRRYLDILGLRLGPRLRCAFDVPDELLARPFPLLLLQPLVENAITHGIEPQVGGGELRIAATLADGRLLITVADTGAGLRENGTGTGFGLENVRQRLRALFGEAARLDVRANEGRGVVARLEIPA
ncbi:MAG: histidine kinase [Rhodocyclaceae bacterium]|nr:histidine kinase [Rhodocyclaceae bacterium]